MNSDLELHTFSLKKIDSGYLFEFGQTDYSALLNDWIGTNLLNGFLEFQKTGEHEFKQISIKAETPKSVISVINEQPPDWLLIRFDFISETGRIIEFYAGSCCLSFVDLTDLTEFIQQLLKNEELAATLISKLSNNLGNTLIKSEASYGYTMLPVFDMKDLDCEKNDENPF